jgi:hypothetical protein
LKKVENWGLNGEVDDLGSSGLLGALMIRLLGSRGARCGHAQCKALLGGALLGAEGFKSGKLPSGHFSVLLFGTSIRRLSDLFYSIFLKES